MIKLDKIPSVLKNAKLKKKVELSPTIISTEGSILAVEVLEEKKIYNKIEEVNGSTTSTESTVKKEIEALNLGAGLVLTF